MASSASVPRTSGWRAWAAIVLSPLGYLGYLAIVWGQTGSPTGWFRVQSEDFFANRTLWDSGKIGDNLQRMRELAVQSANDTNSTSDRISLQAEVSQLVQEIDRIAKTTTFNNRPVLDGPSDKISFQMKPTMTKESSVGRKIAVR